MNLSKVILGRVVRILEDYGVKHAVISPGSRNAPLILAFTSYPGMEVLTIPDERSAGHFALGISQQTGTPPVLICTSGTAPLNYSPAIAEAYYQKLPLLVFTADRPAGSIDQGDGQAIRQNGIYGNFIKKSFLFPEEIHPGKDEQTAEQIIHKAFAQTMFPEPGPVHVNFPFTEPLYGFLPDFTSPVRSLPFPEKPVSLPGKDAERLLTRWAHAEKKMVITGQMLPGHGMGKILKQCSSTDPSVVVLTETTSNMPAEENYITGIDKVVETILPGEERAFAPDLVVTLGGHIVSRKIKSFLSRVKPSLHWHVSINGHGMDMFGCLTETVRLSPETFLRLLARNIPQRKSSFSGIWRQRAQRSENRMEIYLENAPFSDLKVFEIILSSLPENALLHLGNSTPVRYHQLFRQKQKSVLVYGNRGVSGIEGTVSTAAGAAWLSGDPVYLITGDMGFFYDANGLWHHYLKENLKIIVVNNGGGGIFRFIEGPEESGKLPFFEAPHDLTAMPVAELHGLSYLSARDEETLADSLATLHSLKGPVILEVFTPREINGLVLKDYFSELKRVDS